MNKKKKLVCIICGKDRLNLYCSTNHSVLSDGEIIDYPTQSYYCKSCNNIFKHREDIKKDNNLIKKIYETYVLHDIRGNIETRVGYSSFPEGVPKSYYILNFLIKYGDLPQNGRILDIGCHFGSLLKYFNNKFPSWEIHGFDLSERFRKDIVSISNNSFYYAKSLKLIKKEFDLVTMTHVIEHVDSLDTIFSFIKEHLTENGLFFLQCNNLNKNPFSPLLFEQNFNFSESGLQKILIDNGFRILRFNNNWLEKEISFILTLKKNKNLPSSFSYQLRNNTTAIIENNSQLFNQSVKNIIRLKKKDAQFAIFGASYFSRWFGYLLGQKLRCFIDENLALVNKTIMDVPIVLPKMVDPNYIILIIMPEPMAYKVKNRFSSILPNKFIEPPFFIN